MNPKELWANILVEIELNVSTATFNTWFKNVCLLRYEENIAFLGVPNEFIKQWIAEKYHKIILRLLREKIDGIRSIEYVITPHMPKYSHVSDKKTISSKIDETSRELPLTGLYVNKEDNLNPKYVFDNFIVGSFNELAHAAARAVIKNPGINYNPFFVYGGTGYGKTHLIQAIGNYIKIKKNNSRVYYITSEQFGTDYVNALQSSKIGVFKEKYRNYDVLIMDDIQFFSRKDKTQEELFHLFNSYHDSNRQIIFSSDKHPARLPDIESRLISRFSAGMAVEISEPDFESRISILKEKTKNSPVCVPYEVVEYLADSVDGNIRELEGALNSVICRAELQERDASILDVKKYMKEYVKPRKNMSAQEVVNIISSFYGIEEAMIYEKTRRKEIVKPRQIVMYILREDFKTSYPTIGHQLGGRDHTTVIHSCEKIKEEIKTNQNLVQELKQIRSILT